PTREAAARSPPVPERRRSKQRSRTTTRKRQTKQPSGRLSWLSCHTHLFPLLRVHMLVCGARRRPRRVTYQEKDHPARLGLGNPQSAARAPGGPFGDPIAP